jgi:hypothetical protein
VYLYNDKQDSGIDNMRHNKFCEKVAKTTSFVQPCNLPPTAAATNYHSLRVYYQVQIWKGEYHHSAIDWGWKITDNEMISVMTDMPPAPHKLLKIVRCNCKTVCSTTRCSCKKQKFTCTTGCGNCNGISCLNAIGESIDEEDADNIWK